MTSGLRSLAFYLLLLFAPRTDSACTAGDCLKQLGVHNDEASADPTFEISVGLDGGLSVGTASVPAQPMSKRTPPTGPLCSPYSVSPGIYNGTGIDLIHGLTTVEECCSACSATVSCRGWAYNPNVYCLLYSELVTTFLYDLEGFAVGYLVPSGLGTTSAVTPIATGDNRIRVDDFSLDRLYANEIFVKEDFSNASRHGWTLGPEWEFGPATAATCSVGRDPGVDGSGTPGGMVAGILIGRCTVPGRNHSWYWLTSPNVSVLSAPNAVLQYDQYLGVDASPSMESRIEVFDGRSWTPIFKPSIRYIDNSWLPALFNLNAFKSDSMAVRWGYQALETAPAASQWSIDNVQLFSIVESTQFTWTVSISDDYVMTTFYVDCFSDVTPFQIVAGQVDGRERLGDRDARPQRLSSTANAVQVGWTGLALAAGLHTFTMYLRSYDWAAAEGSAVRSVERGGSVAVLPTSGPVLSPIVSADLNRYPPYATLTISGAHFTSIFGNTSLAIEQSSGAGDVSCTFFRVVSDTQLLCSLNRSQLVQGPLVAVVSVNGYASVSTQVAFISLAFQPPAITPSMSKISVYATTPLAVNGQYFSSTAADNVLTLYAGNTTLWSNVTSASFNRAFVQFGALDPSLAPLTLWANVSVFGRSSGGAVPVAVAVRPPTIANVTAPLGSNCGVLNITGTGFSPSPDGNVVVFDTTLRLGCRSVTPLSDTVIQCALNNSVAVAGPLFAGVVAEGVASAQPGVVATIVQAPVVTRTVTPMSAAPTSYGTIQGSYFSTVPGDLAVTLSSSSGGQPICDVVNVTSTLITCLFRGLPSGDLRATVCHTTAACACSGAPVSIATVGGYHTTGSIVADGGPDVPLESGGLTIDHNDPPDFRCGGPHRERPVVTFSSWDQQSDYNRSFWDGTGNGWNSGGSAPQWIEFDMGSTTWSYNHIELRATAYSGTKDLRIEVGGSTPPDYVVFQIPGIYVPMSADLWIDWTRVPYRYLRITTMADQAPVVGWAHFNLYCNSDIGSSSSGSTGVSGTVTTTGIGLSSVAAPAECCGSRFTISSAAGRELFAVDALDGSTTCHGPLQVGGALTVAGNATFGASLNVTGSLTAADIVINGTSVNDALSALEAIAHNQSQTIASLLQRLTELNATCSAQGC